MSDRDIEELLPLSPLSVSILLALSDRNRHGYDVLDEIERQTGGDMRPPTASLYAALHRLMEEGLIERATAPSTESADARRRYFTLTTAGRAALEAEATRLARIVRSAAEKRILHDPGLALGGESG